MVKRGFGTRVGDGFANWTGGLETLAVWVLVGGLRIRCWLVIRWINQGSTGWDWGGFEFRFQFEFRFEIEKDVKRGIIRLLGGGSLPLRWVWR